MGSLDREVVFQDKIRDLFVEVTRGFRFDGLEISRVERNFPIDGREADIVLFDKGSMPFLIIETKKKGSYGGSRAPLDPFAPAVIGQAISYVVLYKKNSIHVPFFATASPRAIAVFKTPVNVEDFIDFESVKARRYEKVVKPGYFSKLLSDKHLIIREVPKLTNEYAQGFIDRLAADFMRRRTLKVSLNYALIEQFRLFVEDLSEVCRDLVKVKVKEDSLLKSELEKMEKEVGYRPPAEDLTEMMTYVLMNKLIFYKVIEGKYRLPPLQWVDTSSNIKFMEELYKHFEKAVEVTGDFEPIFKTGAYDLLPIPDEPYVMERINDFISFLDSIDVEEIGELAGYIYEELIPAEERHRLGQFYTPPAICELITKWAIKSPDDVILDPGVGSGGFILYAYRRVLELKTGKTTYSSKEVHEKILNQLYAIDINPFPAHLTAMNLSMRNARAPSTNMNIIVKDFFNIISQQAVLAPYTVKTAAGEIRREIKIPQFDVIIGNPPYTRWDEVPDATRKSISEKLNNYYKKYALLKVGGIRKAQNPGIYIFWIMHATRFLKDGGKLGMIISDLWLQSDYGIKFTKFLLDHYKINAIIDFDQRLFRMPLISTLVLLIEKCANEFLRNDNNVTFIRVNEDVKVDDILDAVDGKNVKVEQINVKIVKQKDLPVDRKLVSVFSPVKDWQSSKLLSKASELFEIAKGNTAWFIKKGVGTGADPFFYLTPEEVKEHKISKEFLWAGLTDAKYSKYFTFNSSDWNNLEKEGKKCFVFICHKPLDKIPPEINEYIKWGETACRTSETRGEGKICSETGASQNRAKTKGFFGWYDLGEVVHVPIFAIYQAWHKTRFTRCDFPIAMYHALISFIPNIKLSKEQLDALLAFFNSSFIQYYIETQGRRSGGGIIALEVNVAREMPVLDVRKLREDQVKLLAQKFEELENEARKIGGASKKENVKKLMPKIHEIDKIIGAIIRLKPEEIKEIEDTVENLIERRTSRAKEAIPESVKGEKEPKIKPPKKQSRKVEEASGEPLEKFFTSD
ncbi:MAG: N-6 DNA methylase [Nitrososphaeria archaeon]